MCHRASSASPLRCHRSGLLACVRFCCAGRRRPRGRRARQAAGLLRQRARPEVQGGRAAAGSSSATRRPQGYEVRVAALSVQQDLGSIDYLWDDPLNYVGVPRRRARLHLPRAHARRHAERLRRLATRATPRCATTTRAREARRPGRGPGHRSCPGAIERGHRARRARAGSSSRPRRRAAAGWRQAAGLALPAAERGRRRHRGVRSSRRAGRGGGRRDEHVAVRAFPVG